MQRADKHEFVKDLNSVLKKTEFVMVAHYKGLTVSEISNLRVQIKAANSNFKVTKNLAIELNKLFLEVIIGNGFDNHSLN